MSKKLEKLITVRIYSGSVRSYWLTVTFIRTVSGGKYTMTDITDTGVMETLRGNRKKRIREHRRRHNIMDTNTYIFL